MTKTALSVCIAVLIALVLLLLRKHDNGASDFDKDRQAYADSLFAVRSQFQTAQEAVNLKDSTIAHLTRELDSAISVRQPLHIQVNEAVRSMHAAGLDSMQQRLWADPR